MSNALRIAVTGGSGNIGSAVVRDLVARGHTVVNMDRRSPRRPVEGVRFAYVDLRERAEVQRVFETVEAVCHLGEIPSAYAPVGADEIFHTNTRIGSIVLQTTADLKMRHVVYTSTCQVYGTWGDPVVPPLRLPVDESHPTQAQNVYSMSKVANEAYAAYVARAGGLSVSIFRLPVVAANIGQGWMDWVERHKGPPKELGTYLDVADAATAYGLAIEKALPGCETYNLAADEAMALEPIADLLARTLPDWPSLPGDWPASKSPLVSHKAKEMLGWAPKYNFLEEYRNKRGAGASKGNG